MGKGPSVAPKASGCPSTPQAGEQLWSSRFPWEEEAWALKTDTAGYSNCGERRAPHLTNYTSEHLQWSGERLTTWTFAHLGTSNHKCKLIIQKKQSLAR